MNIKKYQECLSETKKVYVDMEKNEFKQKLVLKLKTTEFNREGSGYSGNYSKKNNQITIRGYYSKTQQGQPKLLNDYYYLGEVGEDENGTYFEYVLVKDKLIGPVCRVIYCICAIAILIYASFGYFDGTYSLPTLITFAVVVFATIILNFKKSKETAEMCKACEPYFLNYIKYM